MNSVLPVHNGRYKTVRELVVVLHSTQFSKTITTPLASASRNRCSLEVCETTADHDAVRSHDTCRGTPRGKALALGPLTKLAWSRT